MEAHIGTDVWVVLVGHVAFLTVFVGTVLYFNRMESSADETDETQKGKEV